MTVTEARDKLAALLAPIEDSDPNVLTSLVDTIEPPALMLGWAEPWMEPDTVCFANGHMTVTCVAGRLVPGEGIAVLETLVAYVLTRIATDPASWVFERVTGPRVFLMSKTNYIACRVEIRTTLGLN